MIEVPFSRTPAGAWVCGLRQMTAEQRPIVDSGSPSLPENWAETKGKIRDMMPTTLREALPQSRPFLAALKHHQGSSKNPGYRIDDRRNS